jgi:riboflavin synthase
MSLINITYDEVKIAIDKLNPRVIRLSKITFTIDGLIDLPVSCKLLAIIIGD